MIRKRRLNKRTVIIASSLAAIPLTVVLIAAATNRGRRKSLQTSGLLGRTKSKRSIIITATANHSQQQKEKPQAQSQPTWQESGTKKTEETTTIAATVTSTNTIVNGKDITNTVAVSSTMVPSSTSDSTVIVPPSPSPSPQTSKEEEISVSDEVRKAGGSLKEMIVTAIKEAKDSAKGTEKRFKQQTSNITTTTTADSKDIHSLDENVNSLVGLFEETMTEIRKERYNQQIKLLESYRDLLQTHIKVVDARRRMARKLKPGA